MSRMNGIIWIALSVLLLFGMGIVGSEVGAEEQPIRSLNDARRPTTPPKAGNDIEAVRSVKRTCQANGFKCLKGYTCKYVGADTHPFRCEASCQSGSLCPRGWTKAGGLSSPKFECDLSSNARKSAASASREFRMTLRRIWWSQRRNGWRTAFAKEDGD